MTSYYSALGGKHVAKLKNRNYNVGDRDYVSNCNKPDVTSDEINLAIQKYTDQYLKLDFASISFCSTLPRANPKMTVGLKKDLRE